MATQNALQIQDVGSDMQNIETQKSTNIFNFYHGPA